MANRTPLISRTIIPLALILFFSAVVAPDLFAQINNQHSENSFAIIDISDSHSRQKPGSPQVSIVRALPQGNPEILVKTQGVFKSHIDAPDGRKYSYLSIPGCGATAKDIGYPTLPFKGFFLEVPYGVDVSVELVDQSVSSLGKGFLIHPQQRPPIDSATSEPPFEINREAYATDAFFPPSPIVIDEPGFIRGRRVVFVEVFPLQYNPVSTELRGFSSLCFQLKFKGTPDKTGEARKKRLVTKQSEALAEDLIMNYEPIATEESREGEKGVGMLSSGDGADYLIIVADNLHEKILPLAEWKYKKGFTTHIADMSEVGSTSNDVKNYIQNAYDTWNPAPSYVLLVGDSQDVPPRYYPGPDYSACYTDQPYACVDGNDYYPDLTIGRLPVHTVSECDNVVNKILTYDRDPDTGDWYDDFLAAAYFQDDGDNGVAVRWFMETATTVYDFLVNVIGFTGYTGLCTTHWPKTHEQYHFRSDSYPHRADLNLIRWGQSPYPDPVPSWIVERWTSASQATSDITTAIDWGVGLVQHRDHGGETSWGNPPYNIADINALSNGVKTPVVFSTNCLTGSFHRIGGDCFCEAFLKKSPGGCVGIVGATRTSYSGCNDLLTHGMYTCFWPTYDPSHTNSTYPHSWRPAEALVYGKYYMYIYDGNSPYIQAEFLMFHWFGDPEMMLRTETPQALSVSHITTVEPDIPTDVTVTVSQDGNSVEGALVAITHPSIEGYYWTGYTDANGSVTFSNITFTAECTNKYDIVVTAHNCVSYEGIIEIHKAPVIYVDADANGDNDGTSWENAYESLQDALLTCASDEIWVAEGTYKPTDGNDRSISFAPFKCVAIYGGFAGTESCLGDRDPDLSKNVTILSGDIGTADDANDNCYHVVVGADDVTIDRFTITGGNANYSDNNDGGGMYNYLCSSVTVTNCIFTANHADYRGGGMYNYYTVDVTVSGCKFADNEAAGSYGAGGGIYDYIGSLTLTNSIFSKNEAKYGGGVHLYEDNPTVTNCTFAENEATAGGGMSTNLSRDFKVTNCILWNNYPDEMEHDTNKPTVSFCDIKGCGAPNDWDPNLGTNNGGNIDADPCFVDADSNDFHIGFDSPCINAGDPSGNYNGQTDIDGDARVIGPYVDMGADETYGMVYNVDKGTWYENIQDAIDDALNGDNIEVYPGTHYENLYFRGKAITVRSNNPSDWDVVSATVIDGSGNPDYPAVWFPGGEDPNTVLKGFTVRNGYAGVWCYGANPTISNCIIENYSGTNEMGISHTSCNNFTYSVTIKNNIIRNNYYGIRTDSGASIIENNLIYDNRRGIYADIDSRATIRNNQIYYNIMQGIYIYDGTATIEENQIYNNYGCGVYSSSNSTSTIERNQIYNNSSTGICTLQNSTATIRNNLIYGNSTGIDTESSSVTISNNTIVNNPWCGIYASGGSTTAYNCIIWNNGCDWDEDCLSDLVGCEATYSCISDCNEVNETNYNICADPCFVDANSKDFHINIHSPCVNAGNPNGDYDDQNDIDGDARVIGSYTDMGADETNVPVSDAHQWGLDEKSGTTAYDSVGDSDGTFNGSDPCWVNGFIGGAVDFNGVNDYFSVSSLNDGYNNNSVFTAAGWFKTSQGGMQTIVGQWWEEFGAGHEYYGWQVLVENKKVVARFGHEIEIYDVTGVEDVNNDEWHHFAMVHNGTNIAVYVDGEPKGSGTASFYTSGTKFRIGDGASGNNDIPKRGPFDGKIDDVMLFNRVLSAGEVEQLYIESLTKKASNPNPANGATGVGVNSDLSWTAGGWAQSHDVYFGTTNPPSFVGNQTGTTFNPGMLSYSTTYYWRIDEENPVGTTTGDVWSFTTKAGPNPNRWWKLDECSGTTIEDSVGNDDGTFNGNDPNWVSGKFDCAVDFNGVNDYFSVSSLDDAYNNNSVFTAAGWFKTDQSTGMQTIVGQWWEEFGAGHEYCGWQVLVENNKVKARFAYNGATITDITGMSIVNNGYWHQFAMVRSGTSTALYVDGQPENSGTANFSVDNTKFRIGDGASGNNDIPKRGPFDGIIDNVMIFDRVLSAEEIEQLYGEGLEE
jgi:parallel beta-helix repeat protein